MYNAKRILKIRSVHIINTRNYIKESEKEISNQM